VTRPFRILSLDGSGIMGAFAASALVTFERATGRRVVDHFDLLTGTSTGGIIAIGLAMETPAKEIARFYETERPRIFPRRCRINKWLGRARDIFQPKFSSSALSVAIKGMVGDRSLKEAKTRLSSSKLPV
jgi:patatin-like phospholipase/acyl hydrolase